MGFLDSIFKKKNRKTSPYLEEEVPRKGKHRKTQRNEDLSPRQAVVYDDTNTRAASRTGEPSRPRRPTGDDRGSPVKKTGRRDDEENRGSGRSRGKDRYDEPRSERRRERADSPRPRRHSLEHRGDRLEPNRYRPRRGRSLSPNRGETDYYQADPRRSRDSQHSRRSSVSFDRTPQIHVFDPREPTDPHLESRQRPGRAGRDQDVDNRFHNTIPSTSRASGPEGKGKQPVYGQEVPPDRTSPYSPGPEPRGGRRGEQQAGAPIGEMERRRDGRHGQTGPRDRDRERDGSRTRARDRDNGRERDYDSDREVDRRRGRHNDSDKKSSRRWFR